MAPKRSEFEQEGTLLRALAEVRRESLGDDVRDRLLDVREAAALLGLKPATLYQWAYKRRVPVVKLFGPRGALRFRLSDIEKLIQNSLRPAIRPLAPKG